MNRYTTMAATAALFFSFIAIALNVTTLIRMDDRTTPSPADDRRSGELFCIDGFAYHIRTTSPDSEYGGAKVLEIMKEPKGEPSYDQNGREYPRQRGPKACSS